MSVLRIIIVRQIVKIIIIKVNRVEVDKEVGGFEYSFINFIFKNYSGQDHT